MNEAHASAMEVIRELHSLGATQVKVDLIEVRFDRVFVPLKPVEASIPVQFDGDEITLSASEVQAMRDELEHLRSIRSSVEALGVL